MCVYVVTYLKIVRAQAHVMQIVVACTIWVFEYVLYVSNIDWENCAIASSRESKMLKCDPARL